MRLGSIEAGIKYAGRRDLTVLRFDPPARSAGVFTRSACASAPVEWCRARLGRETSVLVVNAGNANAFTGAAGREATRATAGFAAEAAGCEPDAVMLASTGVIGEPLDADAFAAKLHELCGSVSDDGWWDAAEGIMTTDTYAKGASTTFETAGETYRINGIAKGSGMIAPDMATMLAYAVTDAPIATHDLQAALARHTQTTFNAITVDSDTSTSDTLMAFSTGRGEPLTDLTAFDEALHTVLHDLAMQTVRDGEGATKHVEVRVSGAADDASAKRVALSVANSPLVKTAVAGEDANWGRVVMAVGKAGEPADRDRLSIAFGTGDTMIEVAREGARAPDYDEAEASAVMRAADIVIAIDLGLNDGRATVWTCDLTKQYVAINGDYRS